MRLRFGLDDGRARTLEEIGTVFRITRERVRQIEARALRKLRQPPRNRHRGRTRRAAGRSLSASAATPTLPAARGFASISGRGDGVEVAPPSRAGPRRWRRDRAESCAPYERGVA